MRYKLLAVFFTFLLIIVIGVVVIFASDSAVPGDFLYGLDRKVEEVQISLAERQGTYALGQLYLSLADERITELEKVVTTTSPTVSFISPVYADSVSTIPASVNNLVSDLDDLLLQAQIHLGSLTDGSQQLQLAQQISNNMTRIGYKIGLLSARMNIGEKAAVTNLEDSINELDKSAFGVLIDDINAASIVTTKTTTRIQKTQTQINLLTSQLSSTTVDSADESVIQDLLTTANSAMAQATTFYSSGKYLDAFAYANQAYSTAAQAADSLELAINAGDTDSTSIVELAAQNRLNLATQGVTAASQALNNYSGNNLSALQSLISQAQTALKKAQNAFTAKDYISTKLQADAARDLSREVLRSVNSSKQLTVSVDQKEAASSLTQVLTQFVNVQIEQSSSSTTSNTTATNSDTTTDAVDIQQAEDLVNQATELNDQAEQANKKRNYNLANTLASQANLLLSRAKSLYKHHHSHNDVKGISTMNNVSVEFWF